jgi:hypothetical protein
VCSVCDISAAGVWQTNTIIVVGAAGAAMLVSKYTNIDSSGFFVEKNQLKRSTRRRAQLPHD